MVEEKAAAGAENRPELNLASIFITYLLQTLTGTTTQHVQKSLLFSKL